MPTYDYECKACGHAFERFQSITAPSIRKCPQCGRRTVRRLIGTGAGILFKGSGFYQTDYRSEAYKKDAEKDRKAGEKDKKAGDGGSGKSDSTGAPEKESSGESGSAGASDKRSSGESGGEEASTSKAEPKKRD